MKNIIAVIWDFDKTLVDGYMQDPILRNMTLILQLSGRRLIHCLKSICGNKMLKLILIRYI